MGYSDLVDHIRLSPNSMARGSRIDTITVHMMGNNQNIEACGAYFSMKSAKASSNYGIDSDGRVGLFVDEDRRSQCSHSWQNDDRAITIEIANDTGAPDYHCSDSAMEKLILLCVDICLRHNIERLNFTGDTLGNLTMHKWFNPGTSCPGPFLESKFPWIAEEVNKQLRIERGNTDDSETKAVPPVLSGLLRRRNRRPVGTKISGGLRKISK